MTRTLDPPSPSRNAIQAGCFHAIAKKKSVINHDRSRGIACRSKAARRKVEEEEERGGGGGGYVEGRKREPRFVGDSWLLERREYIMRPITVSPEAWHN